MRWWLYCALLIAVLDRSAARADGTKDTKKDDESAYGTWAECQLCDQRAQETCVAGAAGKQCRRMQRKCRNIESDCVELRKIFFESEPPQALPGEGDDALSSAPDPDAADAVRATASPPAPDAPARIPFVSPVTELAPSPTHEHVPHVRDALPFAIKTAPVPMMPVPHARGRDPSVDVPAHEPVSLAAVAGYSGIGVGAALAGIGAWQGAMALRAGEEYAQTTIQRDAVAIRERGAAAAHRATALFVAGGTVAGAALATLILDALGIFDVADVASADAQLAAPGAVWTIAVAWRIP
ncbi:MAG: hypothetical protein Q7T01_01150 [bacterium]|nr:hypothetical protein [bacterium]